MTACLPQGSSAGEPPKPPGTERKQVAAATLGGLRALELVDPLGLRPRIPSSTSEAEHMRGQLKSGAPHPAPTTTTSQSSGRPSSSSPSHSKMRGLRSLPESSWTVRDWSSSGTATGVKPSLRPLHTGLGCPGKRCSGCPSTASSAGGASKVANSLSSRAAAKSLQNPTTEPLTLNPCKKHSAPDTNRTPK